MPRYRITTERTFDVDADDEEAAISEVQVEMHDDEIIVSTVEVPEADT